MITIYDLSGNILLSTPINAGCKRKYTLMKEDYILLNFSLDHPIAFWLGCYIDDPTIGLFEITDIQKPKFNTQTGGYDYQLRLDAYYWKWKNKIFKYTPETPGKEASWNLTASLDVHLEIFIRNLTALNYTFHGQQFVFTIDESVEKEAKLISYSNTNLLDALFSMAEAFACECWVVDNVIHFGKCEIGDPIELSLDKNISELNVQESKNTYATRIYAFGSTRNLPTNYRPIEDEIILNGVVQKRLMLPSGIPYIDSEPNLPTEQAVEQVVIFDNIYPKTQGKISDLSTISNTYTDEDGIEQTETFYQFKDSGFIFSSDYILPNDELRIVFQSGRLNGLDFAVKFNPNDEPEKTQNGEINPNAQLFEIIENENYGRKLPGGELIPSIGDDYILYGWDSTKIADLGLVAKAESELKETAEKYIDQTKIDPNTYTCKMMSDWVYAQGLISPIDFQFPHHVGDRVTLVNSVYFQKGYRESRIIGIEYNLDKPYDSPIYTVGETTAYSRIGALEDSVDSLIVAGQTYTAHGNGSVYLIRTNDLTAPTNNNAFSALRSLKEFVSKTRSDRTPHDLAVGGKFTAEGGVQFGPNFAGGLTGFGGLIDSLGNAQMQSLVLRQFLEVPELRANRTQILLGNQWNAPGSGIVKWVVPDVDANGDPLPTGTLKLHIEDGEIGAVAEDDLCMGIFHDGVNLATNAVADSDDGMGNFTFAGFRSVYFRITQIQDPGVNSVLRYALRPVSERFTTQWHPSEAMHFVCYGNSTDKTRQTSRYTTRTYERYLTGVDTWEFVEANIAAQFGDLSNLSIAGRDMTRYSIYLNNIYMTGTINQFEAFPLRMEIDTQGDTAMAWGEELPVVCTVFKGWDDVTAKVTRWSVTRDSGVPQDDAVWALKPKVQSFAGNLLISLTAAENDLGNPPSGVTTLFTFRAEIDGQTEPVVRELVMG